MVVSEPEAPMPQYRGMQRTTYSQLHVPSLLSLQIRWRDFPYRLHQILVDSISLPNEGLYLRNDTIAPQGCDRILPDPSVNIPPSHRSAISHERGFDGSDVEVGVLSASRQRVQCVQYVG